MSRKAVGVLCCICAMLAGLLAMLMLFAGVRWLFIEMGHGGPLSLSLALLGGGATSLAVAFAFSLFARKAFRRPALLTDLAEDYFDAELADESLAAPPRTSNTAKTVAIIFACSAGIGVVAIGSCGGLLYVGYKRADSSASPRIDDMFAAIDQDSFAETYDTMTTRAFRDVVTKEQYTELGHAIKSRLGAFQSKSLRSVKMHQSTSGRYLEVRYDARFEKGNGTIRARMTEEGGEWKFVSFRVESPLFAKPLATTACESCGEPRPSNARFCPSCGAKISSSNARTESNKICRKKPASLKGIRRETGCARPDLVCFTLSRS